MQISKSDSGLVSVARRGPGTVFGVANRVKWNAEEEENDG